VTKVIIPIKSERKLRSKLKGRTPDAKALAEVRSLLGAEPRRRDLLIEHLHKIQDRYAQLSAAHLVALAAEMNMALAEVYEVATFYHHFDVIKEGEAAPAAITVRVCASLSCEMAGAKELLEKLPGILGRDVRVVSAPCVGRCETAPVAVIGQNALPHATLGGVKKLVAAKALRQKPGKYIAYAEYRRNGGYRMLQQCLAGRRDYRQLTQVMADTKGDMQNVSGGMPFMSGVATQTLDQKTATGVSIVTTIAQRMVAAQKQQIAATPPPIASRVW